MQHLVLTNKDLSQSNRSLSETIATLSNGHAQQDTAGVPPTKVVSPDPESMFIMNTVLMPTPAPQSATKSAAMVIANPPAKPLHPVHHHLHQCVGAVNGLASSITRMIEIWEGTSEADAPDVASQYERVVKLVDQLPRHLHCTRCGRSVDWSQLARPRMVRHTMGSRCVCSQEPHQRDSLRGWGNLGGAIVDSGCMQVKTGGTSPSDHRYANSSDLEGTAATRPMERERQPYHAKTFIYESSRSILEREGKPYRAVQGTGKLYEPNSQSDEDLARGLKFTNLKDATGTVRRTHSQPASPRSVAMDPGNQIIYGQHLADDSLPVYCNAQTGPPTKRLVLKSESRHASRGGLSRMRDQEIERAKPQQARYDITRDEDDATNSGSETDEADARTWGMGPAIVVYINKKLKSPISAFAPSRSARRSKRVLGRDGGQAEMSGTAAEKEEDKRRDEEMEVAYHQITSRRRHEMAEREPERAARGEIRARGRAAMLERLRRDRATRAEQRKDGEGTPDADEAPRREDTAVDEGEDTPGTAIESEDDVRSANSQGRRPTHTIGGYDDAVEATQPQDDDHVRPHQPRSDDNGRVHASLIDQRTAEVIVQLRNKSSPTTASAEHQPLYNRSGDERLSNGNVAPETKEAAAEAASTVFSDEAPSADTEIQSAPATSTSAGQGSTPSERQETKVIQQSGLDCWEDDPKYIYGRTTAMKGVLTAASGKRPPALRDVEDAFQNVRHGRDSASEESYATAREGAVAGFGIKMDGSAPPSVATSTSPNEADLIDHSDEEALQVADDATEADPTDAGLFSGPGGTLQKDSRKTRPVPVMHSSDTTGYTFQFSRVEVEDEDEDWRGSRTEQTSAAIGEWDGQPQGQEFASEDFIAVAKEEAVAGVEMNDSVAAARELLSRWLKGGITDRCQDV